MSRAPEWREVPPHDFCWACGQGDSTRVIFATGDVPWLAVAFTALLGQDEDTALALAHELHTLKAKKVSLAGHLAVPVQLCRRCAERGAQRAVDAGFDRPPVYSYAKWRKGEYEHKGVGGVFQKVDPASFDRIADSVSDMVCTEELFSAHAEEGLTFRRYWDGKEWAVFYAGYPLADDETEIQVGERLFPDPPEKAA